MFPLGDSGSTASEDEATTFLKGHSVPHKQRRWLLYQPEGRYRGGDWSTAREARRTKSVTGESQQRLASQRR